jgi:hypothetical protein
MFARIWFHTENLRLWKKTFTDPSTSPAPYATTLFVSWPQFVAAAGPEVGGWIRVFSRVECLEMGSRELVTGGLADSFAPFHGFSPVIKSLRMDFTALPSSQTFDLILSFPLLENLTLIAHHGASTENGDGSNEPSTTVQTLSLPPFTGSLALFMRGGIKPITRRLLSLPGGIHFRKLNLALFRQEDILLMTELVEACSRTLEYLSAARHIHGASTRHLCPHQ